MSKGIIYLMSVAVSGLVKIGKTKSEEDNVYYYEPIQVLISSILGIYYIYKDLEGLMKESGIVESNEIRVWIV